MPSYAQLQTEKVNLMLELLQSPENFREHFKWYDIALITLYLYMTITILSIG